MQQWARDNFYVFLLNLRLKTTIWLKTYNFVSSRTQQNMHNSMEITITMAILDWTSLVLLTLWRICVFYWHIYNRMALFNAHDENVLWIFHQTFLKKMFSICSLPACSSCYRCSSHERKQANLIFICIYFDLSFLTIHSIQIFIFNPYQPYFFPDFI